MGKIFSPPSQALCRQRPSPSLQTSSVVPSKSFAPSPHPRARSGGHPRMMGRKAGYWGRVLARVTGPGERLGGFAEISSQVTDASRRSIGWIDGTKGRLVRPTGPAGGTGRTQTSSRAGKDPHFVRMVNSQGGGSPGIQRGRCDGVTWQSGDPSGSLVALSCPSAPGLLCHI